MNTDEMLKDKEQLARIIAFELCSQKYHKELYGENANCYADNNFSDCIKIKEVVDKIYDEGYQKVSEDEFVLNQNEIDELRKDQAEVKFLKNKIKQETAREILAKVDYESNGQTKQITNILRRKYGIEEERNL